MPMIPQRAPQRHHALKAVETPNLLAEAVRELITHGQTFREVATGKLFTGIYSSRLPQELRYKGWKRVPNANEMEDFAEKLGFKVVSGGWQDRNPPIKHHLWEQQDRAYRAEPGEQWQKVGIHQRLILTPKVTP